VRNKIHDLMAEQHGRLALFLPLFLGAGIIAYFARSSEPAPSVAVALAVASVAAIAGAWRWPPARAPLLCAACAATGFALAGLETARAPPWAPLPRNAAEVEGIVAAVEALPAGRRVTIATPSLDGGPPLARALRLRLRNTDPATIIPGDTVRVRSLLQPPAAPDYPGGRDTQREAFFAGIAGYGFAIGPVQLVQQAAPGLWARFWAGLRQHIAQRIFVALPGVPGAVAATLLTGINTAIPAEDRTAYADSGLAHLLAVAGLHVGIVMGLVFFAARLGLALWEYAALAWPTRQIAALAALGAGFIYLELTGAHLPILRSFGMAALATLGVITGRRAFSLRGLAIAAAVLLAAAPDTLMGVSFQMSFSAVLCLIAGYDCARPLLSRLVEGRPWRQPALYGLGLVLSSFLAGTASAPFAAYHFGRATLYYVPANMLAVPITAFWVMPWGLAALILMPAGLDGLALIPMGWGIRGLDAIAHNVAAWPAATLAVPQMPPSAPLLIAAGLALFCLLRGRVRLAGLLPLGAGLLAPALIAPPDLLVGPGATLIALRLGGKIFLQTEAGATAYQDQAPTRLWGTGDFSGFGVLGCTPSSCRSSVHGQTVVLVRAAEGVDCGATIMLSGTWLHDPCSATTPPIIDPAFVQREGATTVRLAPDGLVILTDHAIRGARPWVILEHPQLPMAKTE
jgi:competence protein ComEC